jgi:hypothetical protein
MRMVADGTPVESRNTADLRELSGKRLRLLTLDHIDGRCRAAKRTRELIAALELEAGGAAALTASEREMVKRAAITGALIEDLEARWIAGETIDPLVLATLGNAMRRMLTAVGLKRALSPAAFDENTLIAAASEKAA